MLNGIIDKTTQVLEKSMQLTSIRQSLLASNIANAETPNYRAVDIDFRATMERMIGEAKPAGEPAPLGLRKADPRHLSLDVLRPHDSLEPRIVFAAGDSESIGNDSNSVSLEVQLARLQMNTMRHTMLSRLIQRKISGVRTILESSSRS